jgi:DNA modification methylase
MRDILVGNCRDKLRELPAESAQCVVTSPPYLGLRRYQGEQEAVWGGDPDCQHEWESRRYYVEQSVSATSREAFAEAGEENSARLKAARWREDACCSRCGAWRGAFGLEPTPELYVAHTVEILREIRRVLRPDGVLWWNVGDSYAGSGGAHAVHHSNPGISNSWQRHGVPHWGQLGVPGRYLPPEGLKAKDLMLIPFRVALGAQADGWWVRSVVVWSKPNSMPESVRDRPTESHEYILLLTKSERYFYDADAVREPLSETTIERNRYPHAGSACEEVAVSRPRRPGEFGNRAGRNLRSVWRFATVPYPGAHFAVFPPELPRRCILAGTPPKVCAECGAPWERVRARETGGDDWRPTCECHGRAEIVPIECPECGGTGVAGNEPCSACDRSGQIETRVWSDSALQAWPTRPAVVLDPFAGSGTTLKVAEDLGRWWIGIDICEQYSEQIRARTAQRSLTAAFECTGGAQE